MSRKNFALFIVAVCVLGGIFIFFRRTICSPISAWCGAQPTTETDASVKILAPHYIVYSPAALQAAQQKPNNKVVLYFWAPWCTTCASLDQEIQKNPHAIPDNVTILQIDYDHAADLKKQYNVVTQHTFVQIDQNGHPISLWVGGDPANLLEHLR